MKNCAYCGKENDDDVIYCRECGTEGFKMPASAETSAEPVTPEHGFGKTMRGLRDMVRNLFRLSAGGDATDPAVKLAPHRADLEFVLVLVEVPDGKQLEHTIEAVTGNALAYGGTVLQILGSLVFVGFSGVIGSTPKSQREAFVTHICSSYKPFIKAVHGRASALVGMVGCDARSAYTAIPDNFGAIIGQLSALSPGQTAEHCAQQSTAPNGSPAPPRGDSVIPELGRGRHR